MEKYLDATLQADALQADDNNEEQQEPPTKSPDVPQNVLELIARLKKELEEEKVARKHAEEVARIPSSPPPPNRKSVDDALFSNPLEPEEEEGFTNMPPMDEADDLDLALGMDNSSSDSSSDEENDESDDELSIPKAAPSKIPTSATSFVSPSGQVKVKDASQIYHMLDSAQRTTPRPSTSSTRPSLTPHPAPHPARPLVPLGPSSSSLTDDCSLPGSSSFYGTPAPTSTPLATSDFPSELSEVTESAEQRHKNRRETRKSRAYTKVMDPNSYAIFDSKELASQTWIEVAFSGRPFLSATRKLTDAENRFKKAWLDQAMKLKISAPIGSAANLNCVSQSPLTGSTVSDRPISL